MFMYRGMPVALVMAFVCIAPASASSRMNTSGYETEDVARSTINNPQEATTMNDDMPSPSRPSAPVVAPILYKGVRYEQDMQSYSHGGTQSGGYLVAVDPQSGERLWMLKVYEVPSQDAAGVSTPGRYFRSMRLLPEKGEIEVENEVGGKYIIDLNSRTSTWISGPDSVHK
jgi:hypothetical protein